MDFDLNDDQRRIQEAVREFARCEVEPVAQQLDAEGRFPVELVHKVGQAGVMSIPFPEKFGGMGLGTFEAVLALEQLAQADQSLAVTAMVSMATGLILMRFGTEAQIARFLPDVLTGKCLGAIAGTEPQAGSDTSGFRARAVEVDGGWAITGEKAYITNAGTVITSFVMVLASTRVENEHRSFTLFLVPAGTGGFTPGERYKKMGWKSSDTRPLYFDDCRVGADMIIGEAHRGRHLLHQGYQQARLFLSACSLGLAQASLDRALQYAKDRKAFGGTLGSLQMIQEKIAEMAVLVDTARLLTYRAAVHADAGRDDLKELGMAKYWATDVGSRCADMALQIHGGWGFMDDCAVSRYYRDNRVCTIGDGASEIQKLVIARELGLDVRF